MGRLKIISDPEAIKALSDGLRIKILDTLLQLKPASATTLAEALGESASKISYHLKQLEKHEIIYLAETRSRGNLTENLYAPTAEQYMIQRDLSVPPGAEVDEAIQGAVQEISALISADLLRLPHIQKSRKFLSSVSYGTYFLSIDEIEEVRAAAIAKLDTFSSRKLGPGLLACNIGFLLIDKGSEGSRHE